MLTIIAFPSSPPNFWRTNFRITSRLLVLGFQILMCFRILGRGRVGRKVGEVSQRWWFRHFDAQSDLTPITSEPQGFGISIQSPTHQVSVMINFMCRLVQDMVSSFQSNTKLEVVVKVFFKCDYNLNQQTLSKTNYIIIQINYFLAIHTHTHTYTLLFTYLYVCMCVCLCICTFYQSHFSGGPLVSLSSISPNFTRTLSSPTFFCIHLFHYNL